MISNWTTRRWLLLPLFWASFVTTSAGEGSTLAIKIDPAPANQGRTFEGIGAVSAGASSRLLIDYPEPQRSRILDCLFKPNWGASLQHLKVEIGGDVDSTDGSEPSHMHTRQDENYERGYEWWLMKEAKKRNPAIFLDALAWGAPGWIGGGKFFSDDNIEYLLRFLEGARRVHNLQIDFVGIWNETPYDKEWVKQFKKALAKRGLTTHLVAADEVNSWDIVDVMRQDAELARAVDVVGLHYPGKKVESGKVGLIYDRFDKAVGLEGLQQPIWSSEDGPWCGDWQGALFLAQTYNRNYLLGKMTKTLIWSPVTSYYDLFPLPGSGLMRANTPWSGHFEVQPAIWATAHTTQFARPGWKYLDSACGFLPGKGTYVTLVAPETNDFSLILETAGAGAAQTLELSLEGTLATKILHLWKTNAKAAFQMLPPIRPRQGRLALTLDPDCIYSLTTTTGQGKGDYLPPAPEPFHLPYSENFERYAEGKQARYFSDTTGSYEVQPCQAGRNGRCYGQVVDLHPIHWHYAAETLPASLMGDANWADYRVEAKVFFPQAAEGILLGRVVQQHQQTGEISAYQLHLGHDGQWKLTRGNHQPLAGGNVMLPPGSWQTMSLEFQGDRVVTSINGKTMAVVRDATFSKGLAGIGVAGWHKIQFDDFSVRGLP